MPLNKNNIEQEESGGAPEWMVTFSDCMTLLLTFFVLLLSFSSFDATAKDNVQKAFGLGRPNSAGQSGNGTRALSVIKRPSKIEDIEKGSKTPTDSKNAEGNIAKKRRLTEYEIQKVFSIVSSKLFLGNRNVINPVNKDLLDKMAYFLNANPSRVVICEFDPDAPGKSDETSTGRAWTIMNYFINYGLEADRFSITGSSMLGPDKRPKERQVVITLLEEDVYE